MLRLWLAVLGLAYGRYINEGTTVEEISRSAEAIAAADKTIKDPGAPPQAREAAAHSRQRQIQSISEAAEAFPQSAPVNLKAAGVLIGAGEPALALAPAERALAVERSAEALVQRGMARFGTQDFAGAMEDCRAALALDRRHYGAFSLCKMSQGRGGQIAAAPVAPAEARPEPAVRHQTLPVSRTAALAQIVPASAADPGPAAVPTPWQAIQPARARLRMSALGISIDDAMAAKGITFKYDDSLPPDHGAAWHPGKREVRFPSNISQKNPTEVAVTLAHEGFHAIQTIERGMAASLEAEEEAAFRSFVVYHEMLRAGVPALSTSTVTGNHYQAFYQAASQGRPGRFTSAIARIYKTERMKVLSRLPPALAWLHAHLDSGFLRNMEPVDHQRRNFWNIMMLERVKLDETSKQHHREIQWQRAWINRHRSEFP